MNAKTPLVAAPRAATAALVLAAAVLSGCAASRPVVDPTAGRGARAPEAVQRDIAECSRRGDAAVGRNSMRQDNGRGVAAASGQTAAVGFVATAAASIVTHSRNTWERARGAAAGGATGMATKLLLEWNEGDEVFQRYVERCLDARGHDVLGWR